MRRKADHCLPCRRASPHTPCVFYLPRIEAWALSKVRAVSQPPRLACLLVEEAQDICVCALVLTHFTHRPVRPLACSCLLQAHVLAEDAVDASWCCQVPGGGSSVQYQAGQGKEEAAPEWLGQPPSVRSGGGLQSPSCFNAMGASRAFG